MKIGLIVFSMSGNTLSVAEKLLSKLTADSHEARIVRLEVVPENAKPGDQVTLKNVPDISEYDAYAFASPVMAFRLPEISKDFLTRMDGIEGKQAVCFVTEQLPYPWMGGSRAIRTMKAKCGQKDVNVLDTGIINWSRKDRQERIDKLVERLGSSF